MRQVEQYYQNNPAWSGAVTDEVENLSLIEGNHPLRQFGAFLLVTWVMGNSLAQDHSRSYSCCQKRKRLNF